MSGRGNNRLAPALLDASRRAEAWLRGIELAGLDRSSVAMHGLGLLLCERRMHFLDLVKGSGPLVTLPPTSRMVALTRERLLRLMIAVAKARVVRSAMYACDDLAMLLGALSISYARSKDLTLVAMIVRAAGRLGQKNGLLDEACVYLLDQQAESGAFGLFGGHSLEPTGDAMKLQARLRATVDVLSALDAYTRS